MLAKLIDGLELLIKTIYNDTYPCIHDHVCQLNYEYMKLSKKHHEYGLQNTELKEASKKQLTEQLIKINIELEKYKNACS